MFLVSTLIKRGADSGFTVDVSLLGWRSWIRVDRGTWRAEETGLNSGAAVMGELSTPMKHDLPTEVNPIALLLLEARLHDPHGLLGPRVEGEVQVVRAFDPYADALSIETAPRGTGAWSVGRVSRYRSRFRSDLVARRRSPPRSGPAPGGSSPEAGATRPEGAADRHEEIEKPGRCRRGTQQRPGK